MIELTVARPSRTINKNLAWIQNKEETKIIIIYLRSVGQVARDAMRFRAIRSAIRYIFTFGKSSITYEPIFNVSGSLLHSLCAGSPCFAITSRQNWAIALLSTCENDCQLIQLGTFNTSSMAAIITSLVIPASSRRRLSFSDFSQCDRNCKIRGMTRVSWPHRTSGCASNIARISVVPDLGTPPMNINGICRWYG